MYWAPPGPSRNCCLALREGIFLIVVGAILTFAVDGTVAGLDLDVVGWILMLAGAAGLVLFFYFGTDTAVLALSRPKAAPTTTPACRRRESRLLGGL